MGAVVAGGVRAVAWGSLEKKLSMGALQGWPGRQQTGGGECFQGGRGSASPAAGGGCLAGGGWRLRGVEVEDELLHDQLPRLPHALPLLLFCYYCVQFR